MTGTLLPSTDSKGQPAVLVRAQARDINTMYELRSQVVSGDFMVALTRSLRAHVKSERHSMRQENSKRAEAGVASHDLPAVPAKDEDLDGIDAGAMDMTVYDDDSIWEKLRLMLPWQDEADATKATKRELSQACLQPKRANLCLSSPLPRLQSACATPDAALPRPLPTRTLSMSSTHSLHPKRAPSQREP